MLQTAKNPECPEIRQKKSVLFLNLTNTIFWGPTPNISGTSENFSYIFRSFLIIFMLFLYKKFYTKKKKKKLLTTNPKRYWDVSGNKTFFFCLTKISIKKAVHTLESALELASYSPARSTTDTLLFLVTQGFSRKCISTEPAHIT